MKSNIRPSLKILVIIMALDVDLCFASDQGEGSQIPLTPQAFSAPQRLDHFNKSDSRLWGQKYYISGEYYQEDGPVFVLVGGDRALTLDRLTKEYQWMTWAKRYNALCFYVEQRFFGDSQPTGDLSLDSLQYFTLEQALEDLLDFRALMEYQYQLSNKKWIFFGSENGALLATSLRIQYPNLVDGVVASCSQMTFKLNNSELLNAAFKILEKISQTCVPAIATAVKQIDAFLRGGPSSWRKLSNNFQVCGVLNGRNAKQVEDFYYFLAEKIYKMVSRNAEDDQDVTAELFCKIMNNKLKGAEIDRLAQLMTLYHKSKDADCVYQLYENFVKELKDTSLNSTYAETRTNMYRSCTQKVYFFGSDDPNMPFYSKFTLLFQMQKCADIFGPQFGLNFIISSVKATNRNFGKGTIENQLTNVLFVSGSNDPEKSVQILKDVNTDVKAIEIKGESHCTLNYPSNINDSKDLLKARSTIVHEIGDWINS